MRYATVLLALVIFLSLSFGQHVEITILLPDSLSGLTWVGSLVFHSPTNTIYVGGYQDYLVAVNAQTNSKLERVAVGYGPHLLCSDPIGNKIYSFNYGATVTAIDGATNQAVKTIPVVRYPSDVCYNGRERKLYWINTFDSIVRVIDCVGDSLVAQIVVAPGPVGLCYNSFNNRLYCAHPTTDDVTVIDCAADTLVGTIWVRGVEPRDVCYDSATNCVYTANAVSNTVSVIDCTGDSVVRLVAAGRRPNFITAGPPGKVYCVNCEDSSVSVISDSGAKTVRVGEYPWALSVDPENHRVYCACGGEYSEWVAVIDAARDTVVGKVGTGPNSEGISLCYNPAGNNTYAACAGDGVVLAVGGASDTVEAVITVGACYPGPLCYNTTNNYLYCLDPSNELLFVIDGESNRVLKTLKTGSGSDALIWNPAGNKVYFANSSDSTVSILDCASDSIVATVETGEYPHALCCSNDGKVYVLNRYGGVAVIDGIGDSLLTSVPVNDYPWSLCYDRVDNKVYVGGDGDTLVAIDASGDSVVAVIPLPFWYNAALCWIENHDKLYVGSEYRDSLAVIDCTNDTVLRKIYIPSGVQALYSDSACDKVYGVDNSYGGYLRIVQAVADTFCRNLSVGFVTALLDNGKQGPANRLYCTDCDAGKVTVVIGYKTDSILCRISVGEGPVALAWNPTYSRVYVSNSGSSSISVIRDTFGVGVEKGQPQASSRKPQATVVRGVMELGVGSRQNTGYRAELMDISGRKVLDLKPGTNDVRALAPGVYFVREAQAQAQAQAVTKVVITR